MNVLDEVSIEIAMESLCHVTSAVETRTRIRLHTTSATPMAAAVVGAHSMSTQCSNRPSKLPQLPQSYEELGFALNFENIHSPVTVSDSWDHGITFPERIFPETYLSTVLGRCHRYCR